MINEQQERVEMLLAIITVITGISRQEAQSLLESTVVYENILAGNECTMYESPSATLMEAVGELTREGPVPAIEKITPRAVAALNRWMLNNQVCEAAELVEKFYEQKAASKNKMRTLELLWVQLQNLPDELREKAGTWLVGPQDYIEHLFSRWSGHLGIVSPIMASTRGTMPRSAVATEPVISSDGGGFYHFTIERPASFRFSMERPADAIRPLCLVILSAEDERFSQVYPLRPLGGKGLRVRDIIELPAGNYVVCVPSICGASESGGPANA